VDTVASIQALEMRLEQHAALCAVLWHEEASA
jgi:hypothetical protein